MCLFGIGGSFRIALVERREHIKNLLSVRRLVLANQAHAALRASNGHKRALRILLVKDQSGDELATWLTLEFKRQGFHKQSLLGRDYLLISLDGVVPTPIDDISASNRRMGMVQFTAH